MGEFVSLENDYGDGISVEEYRGTYSLCAAQQKDTGEVFLRWSYPQKNRKPAEKAQPVKIVIGDSQKALEVLREIAAIVKRGGSGQQTRPQSPPPQVKTRPAVREPEPTDDDGLPF